MRKGLWSPDEDEKLRNCIAHHTSGSWSDIARKAGLQRCGKSCRRRWMNHLRPDLKRDKFTEEELKLVANLHETLGNKWSEIATYLVGRTDNDVKNLWNTQIKKQLKNGHYEPHSRDSSGNSDGFLFGNTSLEHMEQPCIKLVPTAKDASVQLTSRLSTKSWGLFHTNASKFNSDNNMARQEYAIIGDHINPLITSTCKNAHACPVTFSHLSRLGEEQLGCFMDECILNNSNMDTSVNVGCTPEVLPSGNFCNNYPSMPMDTAPETHHSNTNVTTSYASWDGVGSSNESSSTGTINVGDDITSVCKPSLYEHQYHLHYQRALVDYENNQNPKDEENDITSLSRRESWSSTSCEEWALETLIGYSDAYP